MRTLLLLTLLAAAPVAAQCTGDANHDGRVTIAELVEAVGNSLGGCPATQTVKPSPTPTPDGAALLPLIGIWSEDGVSADWAIEELAPVYIPRRLFGHRLSTGGAIVVYEAPVFASTPEGDDFVVIAHGATLDDTGMAFAAHFVDDDTIEGVISPVSAEWPGTGSGGPQWAMAEPYRLLRNH